MTNTVVAPHEHDARLLREKAATAKTAVAELASEAKVYAGDRFSTIKSRAAARIKDTSQTVVEYIQQNPYKSLGIAAGVGLLFGLILKRR